ncbi:MAG: hypothetical protein CBD16_02640 [Betaproteobacteria bacterium TMED156]|nr:MAG: hypothetical protein CBD16_02640 [Betaproteobacteria bacterium TMED156]
MLWIHNIWLNWDVIYTLNNFFVLSCEFFFSKNKFEFKHLPIGRGDIFLITVIGIWIGWEILLFVLIFSSLSMLIIFIMGFYLYNWKFNKRLPFGPAIGFYAILIGVPKILVF